MLMLFNTIHSELMLFDKLFTRLM